MADQTKGVANAVATGSTRSHTGMIGSLVHDSNKLRLSFPDHLKTRIQLCNTLSPCSMLTWPAARLMRMRGMKNGETRRYFLAAGDEDQCMEAG